MITRVEHLGKFLHACTLPGEGRDRNIYPAHPNGHQLSERTFMFVYSTRACRGDDDECSGIYQLRRGGFDGPVIKEGWICRTTDEWDALGDGKKYVKQHGHPVVHGVPRGALIQGRRVAHENVFVVCWRREARYVDPATGFMAYCHERPDLVVTRDIEWLQFRLNDEETDIEILSPIQPLRQKGFEHSPDLRCEHADVRWMTQTFVPAVPLNEDCSEWVNVIHVNSPGHNGVNAPAVHNDPLVRIMPIRFAFNKATRLYEWVSAGVPLGQGLFEASVARYRGSFIIAARQAAEGRKITWIRTDDPLGRDLNPQVPNDEPNWFPLVLTTGPDGELRRTGGCIDLSPYKSGRDPIYACDIDPDNGFRRKRVAVLFDGRVAQLPMRNGALVDFPKLLTHTGGSSQMFAHRVRSMYLRDPKKPDRWLSQEEIDASGIYWGRVHFDGEYPAVWRFV